MGREKKRKEKENHRNAPVTAVPVANFFLNLGELLLDARLLCLLVGSGTNVGDEDLGVL